MDYEKEYKDALDRAKAMIKNNPDHVLYESDIKTLFKELQETEAERDERIRQEIINCIAACTKGYTLFVDDIKVSEVYDWLGKQQASETPQWMIDFLEEHRRYFGEPKSCTEHAIENSKLLSIIDWLKGNPNISQKGSLTSEAIRDGITNYGITQYQIDNWLKKHFTVIDEKETMIQWKGDNLKEVLDFAGKCQNLNKWFKSFVEYEKYVHEHEDIFKLFNKDGSHYEVRVGAWLIKTPDNRIVASQSTFVPKSPEHEWTKEDEIGFADALWCINKAAKSAKDENEMGNCWTAEKWIKTLNPKKLREGRKAESSYMTPHKKFFEFIYDRLVNKYGENPRVDYMRSFKERINDLFE